MPCAIGLAAALAGSLAGVLFFGFSRRALGRSPEKAETGGDAEPEADHGQPTVRTELLVQPATAQKTEENREEELEPDGSVTAEVLIPLMHDRVTHLPRISAAV